MTQLKTQDCQVLNQPRGYLLKPSNHLIKMLDAMVNGLEQSLGKRTYLCGNPDCGTLIIFHSNESRPIVCIRCGSEIDWEGKYITRG